MVHPLRLSAAVPHDLQPWATPEAHHRGGQMRTFQVTILADNAAFDDDPSEEIHRILKELANNVNLLALRQEESFTLKDINGNTCGSARWILRP
jgi:hypothetical protein